MNCTIYELLEAFEIYHWAIADHYRHNMGISRIDLFHQRAKELGINVSEECKNAVFDWFDWDAIDRAEKGQSDSTSP